MKVLRTADYFNQERLGALGGRHPQHLRHCGGFCIAPVKALNSEKTFLVNSFDFAGSVTREAP